MRYVAACEHGSWHLLLEHTKVPGEIAAVTYRCHSWRHAGECRQWKAAQDFSRISEAIETRDDWVFLVLTFAQREWDCWQRQYVVGEQVWSRLRLSLRRRYGKFAYVQTWERHRRGGLHVNVLVGNEHISHLCCSNWRQWRKSVLVPLAVAAGFGKVAYVTPFRKGTHRALAGYLTKLANELVGAGQKNQIPFDAPPHFRRIRASRGLLPKVRKSDWTGRMIFSPKPDLL